MKSCGEPLFLPNGSTLVWIQLMSYNGRVKRETAHELASKAETGAEANQEGQRRKRKDERKKKEEKQKKKEGKEEEKERSFCLLTGILA